MTEERSTSWESTKRPYNLIARVRRFLFHLRLMLDVEVKAAFLHSRHNQCLDFAPRSMKEKKTKKNRWIFCRFVYAMPMKLVDFHLKSSYCAGNTKRGKYHGTVDLLFDLKSSYCAGNTKGGSLTVLLTSYLI